MTTEIWQKSVKLPSPTDLMKTKELISNFMISIQYLNIRVDEEHSSSYENSSNIEFIALWVFFKHVYIDPTDSGKEYLTSWIWFRPTVVVCKPAVSIHLSPRISCSPAPATRCPFAINSSFTMWSAPNKAKYFVNAK